MEHVFGAIDKSKVNTGLLKEFGVKFNNIEAFNGVLTDSSWVSLSEWEAFYNSVYSMRIGSATTMTVPSSVFSHFSTQQDANPGVILLAAGHFNYQQYKANAYTNGDVTVTNEKIYDVAGRNPYEIKTSFAVAPLQNEIQGNTFAFRLQSNMVYKNITNSLSSIQIDFGNGQGYQTVSLNSNKNVTYTSGGEKELKFKFSYSGGITRYSHSKIWLDYIPPSSSPNGRFNGSGASTQVITGNAWQGASAIGDITIETSGTDGVLDKPFIVVEGFDPNNDFDYLSFVNNDDIGGINVSVDNSTGQTLNEAIEANGYDLVFVNFRNGTDYIQRNAYMVEKVIEWVNNNKTGNEKNVVMGMSMGGLVARYALRHMEQTSRLHKTKLYISHDTPHQGANVPLAFQAFIRHLIGESISIPVFYSLFNINVVDLDNAFPDLQQGLDLLETPAAQQMLIYQLSGVGASLTHTTNALRTNFLNEYKNMGYPSQDGIRNISISNGSECGTPLDFAPNATIAQINETVVDLPFFVHNVVFSIINSLSVNPIKTMTSALSTNTDVKALFVMKALPNQQVKEIYKGKIFIKKKVLGFINIEEQLINQKTLNSTSSMLPLDNSNGGIYNIDKFVTLPPEMSGYILEPRFNFVPTYSSLDISSGNQTISYTDLTRSYSPLSPPPAPKSVPFDNFFTNPQISEDHTQFTLNNGNWLLDELEGTPSLFSCLGTCGSSNPITVSGPNTICSSGTFSLNNVSNSAVIIWSSSNSSGLSINSSSGVATRKNNFDGEITVTAKINSNCGLVNLTRKVWVGRPKASFIGFTNSVDGFSYFCSNASGNSFEVESSAPGVTWNARLLNWPNLTVKYTSSTPYSGNGPHAWTYVPSPIGYYVFEVRGTNACGTSSWLPGYEVEYLDCGQFNEGLFSVYPNPTSYELNIERFGKQSKSSILNSNENIKVELINNVGKVVITKEFIDNGNNSIDVSSLSGGLYLLKVYTINNVETHRIRIDH